MYLGSGIKSDELTILDGANLYIQYFICQLKDRQLLMTNWRCCNGELRLIYLVKSALHITFYYKQFLFSFI